MLSGNQFTGTQHKYCTYVIPHITYAQYNVHIHRPQTICAHGQQPCIQDLWIALLSKLMPLFKIPLNHSYACYPCCVKKYNFTIIIILKLVASSVHLLRKQNLLSSCRLLQSRPSRPVLRSASKLTSFFHGNSLDKY